jgi:hypothetical protein
LFIQNVDMGLISIPRIKPKRWVIMDLKSVNWGLYAERGDDSHAGYLALLQSVWL